MSPIPFEFMEYLIKDELNIYRTTRKKMNQVEEAILTREAVNIPSWMIARRKELVKLGAYYNQLLDMGDTMAENYNNLLNGRRTAGFQNVCGQSDAAL